MKIRMNMNMDNEPSKGWIAIWRKTIDSEIWIQEPWRLKTWIYLLLEANHSGITKYGLKLKRGEIYIPSIGQLCKEVRWKQGFIYKQPTVNAMKHFWKWLRERQMVDTKKTTRGAIITILNYCGYQDIPTKKVDTKTSTKLDTNGTPVGSYDRQQLEQLNNKQYSFSSNKDKIKAYKEGDRRYKPFYRRNPMRYFKYQNRWEVYEDGRWLEFNDSELTIEWK